MFLGLHRVGNQVPRYSGWKQEFVKQGNVFWVVGNQVPRYSGWKPSSTLTAGVHSFVGNQVPRYSGWKQLLSANLGVDLMLETKYRDIADGNAMMIMRKMNIAT